MLFCLFSSNSFSAAIQEYKGKKYCSGVFGGIYAAAYATKVDMTEYDLDEVINDNKLNFIGIIISINQDEILNRGYIQRGDKFLLSDEHPNVLATYLGPRRDIDEYSYITRSEGSLWGIGHAVYGGEIVIEELIMDDDEYSILEDNLSGFE